MIETDFKTGDIICLKGRSTLLRRLVAWFTRGPNEPKTYARHIAGFKNCYTVTEANIRVTDTQVNEWIRKHKDFEIWRYKLLTENEQEIINNYLKSKKGNIYGGWKLLAFAIDLSLTKILKKDVFMFRRMLENEKYPICSWLFSYAYDNIGYKFGELDPNLVDPDTMHDDIVKNSNWKLVYKKGR